MKDIEHKRPGIITVMCILGFIWTAISVLGILLFSRVTESFPNMNMGEWYPFYLIFITIAGFISMIGFWMMRKWGVFLFISLTMLACAVNIITDSKAFFLEYGFLGWIPSAIVMIIVFYHFKKMS